MAAASATGDGAEEGLPPAGGGDGGGGAPGSPIGSTAGAGAAGLCASFPNLLKLEPLPDRPLAEIDIPALPPGVVQGTLRNGFTYHVLANSQPKQRAEVHLVVGFGSLVEEEDQRGGAHIIEHLGFSATKNFENHDIVRFLESIGASFGACQNAYTTFDRTVYHLHVRTDDWAVFEKSLSVLREFAFWTRISSEDVARERSVVLDEWRQSKSAMGRLMESYTKAIAKGSQYEVRLPIGIEEVIRNCPAERLCEFYRKYYHPGQMALIAVGDFDVEQAAGTIRSLFDLSVEELGREATVPPRTDWPVPPHTEPRFVLSEDPELAMSVALIENIRPRRPPMRTVADFEQLVVERIFLKALNNRLFKVTMRKDSIVFQASVLLSVFCPAVEGLQVSISPAEGKITEAILLVLLEIERVKRFGLHDSEVHRAKLAMLADCEEAYIERNQTDSHDHAGDLTALFLEGIRVPGCEFESRMARAVLGDNTIDTARVAKMAESFDPWGNTVYKVCAPRKALALLRRSSLREADLRKLLERLRDAREGLEPWPEDTDDVSTRLQRRFKQAREEAESAPGPAADMAGAQPAEAAAPAATEVREIKFGEAFGTAENAVADLSAGQVIGEEFRLVNGMRVFLRRNDIFDDEVLLRGECWGGLSEVMDDDSVLCEALNSAVVASELEAYGMRPEELTESMEGLRVSPPSLSIGCYRSQVSGECSPADLEMLLLLLHLLFSCPVEPKPDYLETLMHMLIEQRLAEDRSPHSIYSKRCNSVNTMNHPFYRSPSLRRLKRLDFATACGIFNAKLRTPADWTLVLVGKLPPTEEIMVLLEKYVSTLRPKPPLPAGVHPAIQAMAKSHTNKTLTVLDVQFPKKVVPWEEVRVQMVDPQCRVLITAPLQLELSTEANPMSEIFQVFALTFLWHLLETKLCERLRFELGKTYKVSIGDSFEASPPHPSKLKKGTVSISFGCDPKDAQDLTRQVQAELAKVREQGFEEREVTSVREQERLSFEKSLRENGFWENLISNLYHSRSFWAHENDIEKAVDNWKRTYDESIRMLSPESSKATLLRVLPPDGVYTVVVMMPQAAPTSARCTTM